MYVVELKFTYAMYVCMYLMYVICIYDACMYVCM